MSRESHARLQLDAGEEVHFGEAEHKGGDAHAAEPRGSRALGGERDKSKGFREHSNQIKKWVGGEGVKASSGRRNTHRLRPSSRRPHPRDVHLLSRRRLEGRIHHRFAQRDAVLQIQAAHLKRGPLVAEDGAGEALGDGVLQVHAFHDG